jgi:multidrug efflux pump subunit AcrA (membrane-fusion protein)
MSEQENARQPEAIRNEELFSEGGLRAPPHLSTLGKIWWWFDFLILVKLARLRFIGGLAVIGLLIVYWDTLLAYYDKWTRPIFGSEQVASSDTEFFCPMHPQVVTNNPREKCPICFMNLSKRKKGEATADALPAGVVQRLQLSPYRVVTAGIQTWEVKYEPLAKQLTAVGTVEYDERKLRRISVRPTGRTRIDQLFANVTGDLVKAGDDLAMLYNPDLAVTAQNLLDAQRSGNRDLQRLARDRLRLWGIAEEQIQEVLHIGKDVIHLRIRSPISGHIIRRYVVEGESVEEGARLYDVADLSSVWIEAQIQEDELAFLQKGLPIRATIKTFPSRVFSGKLAFIFPHLDATTRTLRVRFDIDNPRHELRPGMYANVTIDVPATHLGQQFLSRDGQVLAVPETAVIHTGSQKLVFRQYAPTVFDAVPVELGPPLTGANDSTYYPVIKGLEAGERVVTVGSFLLDAETRVSAAAGSIYYGGTGAGSKSGESTLTTIRPTTPEDEEVKVKAALAKLSTPDRRLAEGQRLCPVLKSRLGSMGTPFKVILKGQPVFLCCKGCETEAREHPDQTLATVEKLKAGVKGTAPAGSSMKSPVHQAADPAPPPALTPEKEAKIQAALTKLGDEDRRLAQTQKYCAIQTDKLLGSMGPPFKMTVKGQPVFVCCQGCEDDVKAEPDQTLGTVEKLKAKAKAGTAPPRPAPSEKR